MMYWDKIVVETEKVIDPNPKVWIDAAVENCYNGRYQEALEQIRQTRNLKDCDDLIRIVCDIVETYLYAQMGDYGNYHNKNLALQHQTMQKVKHAVDTQKFKEHARYWYELGQKISTLNNEISTLIGDTEFKRRYKHFLENYFINFCAWKLCESRRVLGCNIETVDGSDFDDLDEIIAREKAFFQKVYSKQLDLTIKKVPSSEFRFIKEMIALLSKAKMKSSGLEYTVDFVEAIP